MGLTSRTARLTEIYPDCVFSKTEFTALLPYLSGGADFAFIPSRDESSGLVAVELGCKGAFGTSSRLGGLGLMPDWVRSALGRPFSCDRSIPSGLGVVMLPS